MKSVFRFQIAILSLIALTACGTLQTGTQSDSLISRDLKRFQTHCHAIPRIYSGVSYDLCMLNGSIENELQQFILGYYLVDTVPSALADTLLLPYTGFRQWQQGNIKLR